MTDPVETPFPSPRVGIVVIGRNEGQRLGRCLATLPANLPVVYVDSGSTDGSAHAAAAAGVDVLQIREGPFSAARARNAGIDRLLAVEPSTALLQFVDGDCELANGWIESAAALLAGDPSIAAAVGTLREARPEASLYNWLSSLEWRTSPGEIPAFGGIAMVRVDCLERAGRYDPRFVAGEERDLSVRIRRLGARIVALGCDMATHDADITRLAQWWRRCVRGGYALAALARRHPRDHEQRFGRRLLSSIFWGACVPLAILGLLGAFSATGKAGFAAAGALAAAALLLQWARLVAAERPASGLKPAMTFAAFLLLAKMAQVQGMLRWAAERAVRRPPRLIEHKLKAAGERL